MPTPSSSLPPTGAGHLNENENATSTPNIIMILRLFPLTTFDSSFLFVFSLNSFSCLRPRSLSLRFAIPDSIWGEAKETGEGGIEGMGEQWEEREQEARARQRDGGSGRTRGGGGIRKSDRSQEVLAR
jgi:hypothetical protein